MFIETLSTLISSIALVGVVISLYLQARQLRSAQVDSTAISQRELMNFALEHADVYGRLTGIKNPDDLVEQVVLNWQFYHIRTSYMNSTIPDGQLRKAVLTFFSTEMACKWWATAGQSYMGGRMARREKKFIAIVNEEFQRQKLASENVDARTGGPDRPNGSSAPPS
jgi:hypothetical protein